MAMQRRPRPEDKIASQDSIYYRAAGLILAATLGFLGALLTVCGASESVDEWTARDKQMHAAGGFAISAVSYALVETFAPETRGWKKHALAIGASVLVGAAKEAYDYQHPDQHTCDARDFVATAAGGVLGSISASFVYQF